MKKSSDNSFGTASVVLGILSITLSTVPGIILGIVAIVFANKQHKLEKNSWSRAGKLLGIIGIILGIIAVIAGLWIASQDPEFLAQQIGLSQ